MFSILKDFTQEVLDFIKDLIIIIAIVVFVRTFLVMPFQINGQSMYDSYYDKEFILVDRFSYLDLPIFWQVRPVHHGDVVVFRPGVSESRKFFIKRVIGMPWDSVKIVDGKVYVQHPWETEFEELSEGYLDADNNGNTFVDGESTEHIYEVPEGQFFVLGDNRQHSTDGRSCFQSCSIHTPYISADDITGKVFMDLGYFNFRSFSFTNPDLGISTFPRFFSSPATYSYE